MSLAMIMTLLASWLLSHEIHTLRVGVAGLILRQDCGMSHDWSGLICWERLLHGYWYVRLWRFLLGGSIGAIALFSGWLCRQNRAELYNLLKLTFGVCISVRVTLLLIGFSAFYGETEIAHVYPIVAISDAKSPIRPESIPILLDSDEKQYALLILSGDEKAKKINCLRQGPRGWPDWTDLRKEVIVLPRSDIQSISTLGMADINPFGEFRSYCEARDFISEHQAESVSPVRPTAGHELVVK